MIAPAGSEDAGLVLSAEPGGDLRNAVRSVYDRHDHRKPLNHVNVVEWIEAALPVVAAHVEAARAEERERIAAAIEGERNVAFLVGDGSGWSHAITRTARIARTPPPTGDAQGSQEARNGAVSDGDAGDGRGHGRDDESGRGAGL